MSEIHTFLDPAEILEALNRHKPTLEAFVQMREEYLQRRGAVSAEAATFLASAAESRALCKHVDEWLGTGISSDGSEAPFRRELFLTAVAKCAAIEFVEKHPPSAWFSANKPGLVVAFGEVRHYQTDWTGLLTNAQTDADCLFTRLLASDWKENLCKCRYCGSYFIKEKLRRHTYRNGIFCSREHERHANAARCTSNKRRSARKALIEVAANELCKRAVSSHAWQTDKQLKIKLANAVSHFAISVRGDVKTINWITHNCRQIEQKRLELARKKSEWPVAPSA
jgi:hypothetical protein